LPLDVNHNFNGLFSLDLRDFIVIIGHIFEYHLSMKDCLNVSIDHSTVNLLNLNFCIRWILIGLFIDLFFFVV
jgi:hypothetical protein